MEKQRIADFRIAMAIMALHRNDPSLKIDRTAEDLANSFMNNERFYVKFNTPLYDTAAKEYAYLVKIHKILPDNTPTPVTEIKNDYGKVVAYVMTRVLGITLKEFFDGGQFLTKDMFKNLQDLIRELHNNGLGHGDLAGGHGDQEVDCKNIMITPDRKVVLLDPWPEGGYGHMSLETRKANDERDMNKLKEKVR